MVDVWDRFRQNDDKAFSILFETYVDVLYGYGRKFVSDEDFVKDCVQDLFVKLYNNRSSLSGTPNPKFYLLLSLKNIMIDSLVKTRRMTYVSPDDLPFLATGYYMQENETYGGSETEAGKRLEKILGTLNARQKEAIYLRFQQGLSYEEVSRLLGINYQSVRNLIHRAITKIRATAEAPEYVVEKA